MGNMESAGQFGRIWIRDARGDLVVLRISRWAEVRLQSVDVEKKGTYPAI